MTNPDEIIGKLSHELVTLRERIAVLETAEAGHKKTELELRLFKTIVESSHEAIAVSDAQGQLVYTNPAHARLFGHTLDEAKQLNHRDFYPPEAEEILNQEVAPALTRGESWEGELEAFDAQGRRFPLWERVDRIRDADGEMLYSFGFMHDITNLKQTEEALHQRVKTQTALYEASRIFLDQVDVETTLAKACQLVVDKFGLKMAWIGQVVKGSFTVEPAVSYGFEEGYLSSIKITWDDSPTGQGPSGTAIKTAQAVPVNRIDTDPMFAPWRTAALARGFHSVAALPLCYGEKVLGLLNVYSAEPDFFTADRLQVLQSFANLVAVTLQRARLYWQLEQHAADLERRVAERTAELTTINHQLQSEIAERKRIEESLRDSERRFRTVADFTYGWEYWISEDGVFEYVSPGCQRITECNAEEFLQDPNLLLTLVHPDDRHLIEKHLAAELESHEVLSLEFRIVTPSGKERWVSHVCQPIYDDGTWLGRRASNRNITERKHAEASRRESEERYRSLFNAVPVGLFRSTPNGQLLDANPAFVQMLGYPDRDSFLAVNVSNNYLDPEDRQKWRALIERTGFVRNLELQFRQYDGTIIWIRNSATAIRNEDGQVMYYEGVTEDITAHKRAEEERARFTNQLRTAAEVSTQLAAILDIEQLLYNVVTLLQRRFNLYHVHVYLLNEIGDDLIMRVGSGEIGRVLRQRSHHISLNHQQSLVASAARQRQLITVDNVHVEPAFLANPLLPETRSEVAIPLIVAEKVMGVLDVQDNTPARFTQSDLDVFSTLAGQIAIALHNAHLFDQQRRIEKELRETKDQLEAILQGIADGISVIDGMGQLVYVNEAAARAVGFTSAQTMLKASPTETLSKFDVMDESGHPFPLDQLPSSLVFQGVQQPVANLRFRNRETGEEEWSVIKATPILDENGQVKFAVTITHDITKRKKAEESLQRYTARLQTLRKIDRDILAARLPEKIAQVALNHIRHMIPCIRATVVEFDLEKRNAKILAVHIDGKTRIESEWILSTQAFNIEILEEGRIHVVKDIQSLPAPSPLEQALLAEGVRSYINVPLIVQAELIGSLNVGASSSGSLNPDHLDIAEEVADSLAIAIQYARLFEQAQRDAETKARLLHEVNHRVKNNLAAIVGLLYVEQNHKKNQPVCQALLSELINRVEGLATVHHLLSASQWSNLRLSELATQIIDSVLQTVPSDKRVLVNVFSVGSIYVIPKQANSLAMVINELATNTIKYAVLTRHTVSIDVRIARESDTIFLEYRDDGPGFPIEVLESARGNVGMYLIHNIIYSDLHGEVSLENDNGAVITVRFKAIDERGEA